MATSSYSNLFGTTGAGQQGSKAGIGTMFGQQAKPQETEEERQQRQQQAQQPSQTFAQLQKQGMARPAPQAPQAQPFAQFGGSQQAQQARAGMLGQLQQQLAQPTRFDTEAFQRIRQAQAANLQSEFQEQQRQLNEELARRGLSASTIGAAGMARLGGAQARALADIDVQLLQQAAQTQAQDRLAAMQAASQFAELAGAQDLSQFEANRVAQAAEFEQALRGAQFGQQQTEFERQQALAAAQAQQAGGFQGMELGLRQALGLAELTGEFGGQQTLAARQQAEQQRQFDIQQALQRELGVGGLGVQQAQLGLRERELAQTAELERERLAAQQAQFGQQLGFNREELALRGELGRGEQAIAENRLAQEGRLEEARQAIQLKELGQREAQFESTLGAEEQRFVRTLKEQQEARLQQLGISTRQLDLDATRIKQDAELQGRSLTLQEARDAAEVEYRTNSLAQQAALQGRSLDIEQARNEATIGFQRDQLGIEEALRREGIAVDRERLTAAQKQFDADIRLRETLGLGELTGTVGGEQTLAARQQQFAQGQAQQQLLIQLASALAQSSNIPAAQLTKMMNDIYAKLGTGGNPLANLGNQLTGNDLEVERLRGRTTTPQGTPQGTPPRGTPQTTTQTQQTSTGRSGRRGG